ncbi:MAG: ATP-grasp domain-containing protein [Opitutaceae bacterium]|jgi:hypothetical protein
MHWLFHFLNKPDREKAVVVVIWGVHTPDWMAALNASAPVWEDVPRLHVVLNLSSRGQVVPLKIGWGRRIVVIPLMERHIARHPRRYETLVPTMSAMRVLGDKGRFADYIEKQGLGHLCPVTYKSIESASFPCVIKRTNLNGGKGVAMAVSLQQARQLMQQEPFAGRHCIVQAAIPFTVEYVVHCVCLRGSVLWHAIYAYEFEKQHIRTAGSPGCTVRRSTIPGRVIKDLEAMLLPLEYSGPCNVDCTWDDDGRLVVFEINPRLGGSLMCPENTVDLAACLSVIIDRAS